MSILPHVRILSKFLQRRHECELGALGTRRTAPFLLCKDHASLGSMSLPAQHPQIEDRLGACSGARRT